MIEISPQTITLLPSTSDIVSAWQKMAMFDAVLTADRFLRVFEFEEDWMPQTKHGSINNGQGDCIAGVFGIDGAIIEGYNARAASEIGQIPWMLAAEDVPVPACFRPYLRHRAMDCGGCTFCVWRTANDKEWQQLQCMIANRKAATCPIEMLGFLCGKEEDFREWALENYVEMGKPAELRELIRRVFAWQPLSEGMLSSIDLRGRTFKDVRDAALKIGYPSAG